MTDETAHIARAEHNDQFRGTVPAAYEDWAVVGSFYSILHYVDAWLARKSLHPQSHREREWLVAHEITLATMARSYLNLHRRCDDARYRLIAVKRSHVQGDFQQAKTTLRGLLGLK